MRGYNDGPQLLPPVVKGQQIRQGPYTITVTDEMVQQVQMENERRRRQWEEQERRRRMAEEQYQGEFKEFDVRQRFIRRVFLILFLQLLFTGGVCAYFILVDDARRFILKYPGLQFLATLSFIFTFLAVSCSDCARSKPCNIVCLLVLTSSLSYTVAYVCLLYSLNWVLISAGTTAFVTVTIWALATCTEFDLTKESGAMLIITLVGFTALILMLFVSMLVKIPGLHIAFGLIGSLIISMYLFFDVQTLMGGRTVELNPDEVIYAAVLLYVDIVLLFKYILLMGNVE